MILIVKIIETIILSMNLNSESRRANENIYLSIVYLQCCVRKYLVLRQGRGSERAKNHWLSDSQVLLG